MDIRFGTLYVRSLYRSGSSKAVSRELAKYKLHLVGVQEVRWDKDGTEPADNHTFFYGNRNADHHLEIGSFVHEGIISTVKREEFVSNSIPCVMLKGCWHDIIYSECVCTN
jgi:hypothetical protein